MNFGQAIEMLKQDKRVARTGWNGKGMFLYYMSGYPNGVPANENMARALGILVGQGVRVLPYIGMSTADGSLVPWLASQTDILAEDWTLVD